MGAQAALALRVVHADEPDRRAGVLAERAHVDPQVHAVWVAGHHGAEYLAPLAEHLLGASRTGSHGGAVREHVVLTLEGWVGALVDEHQDAAAGLAVGPPAREDDDGVGAAGPDHARLAAGVLGGPGVGFASEDECAGFHNP